jgi:hypothetical protein
MEKKRSLGSVRPAIGFGMDCDLKGGIPDLIIHSFAKLDTFKGYTIS